MTLNELKSSIKIPEIKMSDVRKEVYKYFAKGYVSRTKAEIESWIKVNEGIANQHPEYRVESYTWKAETYKEAYDELNAGHVSANGLFLCKERKGIYDVVLITLAKR